jgi:hypothetical protein
VVSNPTFRYAFDFVNERISGEVGPVVMKQGSIQIPLLMKASILMDIRGVSNILIFFKNSIYFRNHQGWLWETELLHFVEIPLQNQELQFLKGV